MPTHTLQIVTHDWARFDEVLDLNYRVLYEPFGVARDAEWYHPAHGSAFSVALADDGRVLGSARLLPSAGDSSRQLRQVSVAGDAQGLGIGRELMAALEEVASREGAADVWLNARCSAYGFYERLGYVFEGEEFESELTGIPHRAMRKRVG